jgi:hypothetical protein
MAFDAAGNIVVSSNATNVLMKIRQQGGQAYNWTTMHAASGVHRAIVADEQFNYYVADYAQNTIWKVDNEGVTVSFNNDFAIGVTGLAYHNQTLYAALHDYGMIIQYDHTGNGTVFGAEFGDNALSNIAFDSDSNLYATFWTNNKISKSAPSQNAKPWPAVLPMLWHHVTAVAANDSHHIFIFYENAKVVAMTSVESLTPMVLGKVNYTWAWATGLGFGTVNFMVYHDHSLYISDHDNGIVWQVGADGGLAQPYATSVSGSSGIAFGPAGELYVASNANNQLLKYTSVNGLVTFASGLSNPYAVAVDASGTIYVTEQLSNNVKKVTAGGSVSTLATVGSSAGALAIGTNGNLILGSSGDGTVYIISPAGNVSTAFTGTHDSTANIAVSLNGPLGGVFIGLSEQGTLGIMPTFNVSRAQIDNIACAAETRVSALVNAVTGSNLTFSILDSTANRITSCQTTSDSIFAERSCALTLPSVAGSYSLLVESPQANVYGAASASSAFNIVANLLNTKAVYTGDTSAAAGSSINLAAMVPVNLGSSPSGTFTFSANGQTLCTANAESATSLGVLVTSGSCSATLNNPGTYTITVAFSGAAVSQGCLSYSGSTTESITILAATGTGGSTGVAVSTPNPNSPQASDDNSHTSAIIGGALGGAAGVVVIGGIAAMIGTSAGAGAASAGGLAGAGAASGGAAAASGGAGAAGAGAGAGASAAPAAGMAIV